MPSEFARNLAQTLEREATGKGGESSSRPTDPKGGESRPTDKRVGDGTGQGGGLGEALK